MNASSKLRLVLLALLIAYIVILVLSRSRLFRTSPGQVDSKWAIRGGSDAGERTETVGADTSPGEPASAESTAESEDEDELLFEPPPDAPAQRQSGFREQFEAQLRIAAEANGLGTAEEACLEWGRLLALALDDEASDNERSVALLNVSEACSRDGGSPRRPHELRLAHEALVRRVEDDPHSADELERFLSEHPNFADTRAAFLVANQHPAGTRVSLDGQPSCTEPCTVAVPVDGESHRISFAGPGGARSSVDWRPATPDAAAPPLPELTSPK